MPAYDVPTAQAWHEVLPLLPAYLPEVQFVHALEPALLENCPVGQAVQAVTPVAALKRPAVQLVHEQPSLPAVPATHGVHPTPVKG